MDKKERLEVIQTLVESEKSDQEILEYLKETVGLKLKDSTLQNDIKAVREALASEPNEEEDSAQEEQEQPQDNSSEEDSQEEDESVEEEDSVSEDEHTVLGIIEAIKSGKGDELKESAVKDLNKVDFANFERLYNVALGRIDLEASEKKRQEAVEAREAFLAKLAKSINPAIEHLVEAQEDIDEAIKLKRKEGKNVTALVGVKKVLIRQAKSLGRQISG